MEATGGTEERQLGVARNDRYLRKVKGFFPSSFTSNVKRKKDRECLSLSLSDLDLHENRKCPRKVFFNVTPNPEGKKSWCLTLTQTTNFRLFQIERVYRRQFQIRLKWQKVLQTGRKTLWKKEKLLVTSNFSLFHSVSKRLYSRHVKTRACYGKG